ITIHNFVDNNIPNLGVAYVTKASKWNFAWAVHAGLAYKISKNVYAEFSYRHVWLGDGVTGDLITYTGTNNVNNPTTFRHLTSHDFRFGLRINLDCNCSYSPPPPVVYQPPPPVYQPPPQYYPPPPPLRSKG
ncbi:MAG: hypothetical protein JO245_01055, partial [Pseudolabrys sp.]|nr:hypothetical protein [Pseudolabrys sp.]